MATPQASNATGLYTQGDPEVSKSAAKRNYSMVECSTFHQSSGTGVADLFRCRARTSAPLRGDTVKNPFPQPRRSPPAGFTPSILCRCGPQCADVESKQQINYTKVHVFMHIRAHWITSPVAVLLPEVRLLRIRMWINPLSAQYAQGCVD